ncbi:ubiquitin domain-containing protein 1-like [Carassius carassius]|uniref:ubiquitin domain-containing protein 1-like n=1 Tax=Carassius carassius TaxID=217509 RepID=UPI00286894F9|nr:ubiquitin domain-containing protein 1-like [Carassius carassius]
MGVANSRDYQPTITVVLKRRNEPLKKDKPKWKSEYPMTEGQLRSKRDEFWDTAPAFDGCKEIWDVLKAAAVAIECNDHELAQAIVDGASITLPRGSLMECYDELGNRYQLPAYCLAPPVNLVSECNDHNVSEHSELQEKKEKEFQQLQIQEDIDATKQRWFFSGKLTDKTRLQDTKLQKDFVIQVIINQPIVPN